MTPLSAVYLEAVVNIGDVSESSLMKFNVVPSEDGAKRFLTDWRFYALPHDELKTILGQYESIACLPPLTGRARDVSKMPVRSRASTCYFVLARSIPARMRSIASEGSVQRSTFTHFPGSRSL